MGENAGTLKVSDVLLNILHVYDDYLASDLCIGEKTKSLTEAGIADQTVHCNSD